ncbi:hypothetical protein P5673_020959 [Acropora cervicornis]|uniref:Uncharacterized protein n=1 Tax=Acropora cervicornis TaxID=6130 RepID=A0AAD9Q9B6_ACRCE|nr:hypothetical protein P5673_020959 [Acropora cervicornis]
MVAKGLTQGFIVDESPDSERNQALYEKIKGILKKEHGGENCQWTDLQMEGYYFGMCKCILCTFFFQKLERRCSGFDVLKPSLSAKERMYCEEILFIDYMSSEESDYKEQEDPITTQSFGRISDQKTSMGENYAGKCEDKTRSGSQKHLNTTCQTNGKVKACGRSLRKAGT